MANLKNTFQQFRDTSYYISKCGFVLSTKKNGKQKLLKPAIDKDGYKRVDISKEGKVKHFHIHRLVAECWIPNPKNLPQVNHKNAIKSDNVYFNLEWCTGLENTQHANRLGLSYSPKGEKNHFCKITENEARKIKELLKSITAKEVASQLKISYTIVSDIRAKRTWSHL